MGKGRVFLLGFCLQDTYFKTWQDDKPAAREQLAGLLHGMTEAAGVQAQVRSSNPDIEASVRANAEGRVFVCHQSRSRGAGRRPFGSPIWGSRSAKIVDLADGQAVRFTEQKGGVELSLSASPGPDPAASHVGKVKCNVPSPFGRGVRGEGTT